MADDSSAENREIDREEGPRKATIAFIFVTVVLDMLAIGVVIPVLPKLILGFEGGSAEDAAGWQGLFGTVFAGLQFLAAPFLGALSDRFGRRPLILLSNLGLAADYVLMALAPSIWWLLVGRVVAGLLSATVSIPGAYIADTVPPEKRAASFGLIGAAFGLGFVVGPAVGGIAGATDPRLPFRIAAALSLLNFLYGCFVLPESLPPGRRAAFDWRRANPIGALAFLGRTRGVSRLAVVAALSWLAHDSLPQTFFLYAHESFGWDTRMVGLAMAAVGSMSMLVSGVLVGRVVRTVGEPNALRLGLAAGTTAMLLYAFAGRPAVVFVAILVGSFWAVSNSANQSLMTRHVDPAEQGRLHGALASLRAACQVTTPSVFNGIFAAAIRGPRWHFPGAPFLLAALLMATALAIATAVARGPETQAA